MATDTPFLNVCVVLPKNLSLPNDKIVNVFDKGMLISMVLIDLQKAFDNIDHDIFCDET